MRAIWTRGADECFVHDKGIMADGASAPPPRRAGRYDLSLVLATAASCADPDEADRHLTPVLDDAALRHRFVAASMQVRKWLQVWAGSAGAAVPTYMARQAARKNAVLVELQRDHTTCLPALREAESLHDASAIGQTIDRLVTTARRTLADLDPDIGGRSGRDQLLILAQSLS